MYKKELGIIGIGKIGNVLLEKAISNEVNKENIIIYDIDFDRLNDRSREYRVNSAKNNAELVQNSKYILIAVIPQVIDNVLEEIGSLVTKQQTIITIDAGVSIAHFKKYVHEEIVQIHYQD